MYNLYIYEKQLLEKQRKKEEEIKNNKFKEKRKSQIKRLFSNYCKRMNKFIISLCNNPIIIQDPLTPSDCRQIPQKNIINRSFSKSNSTYKNFIFGGFMTDRKRIELLDQKKKLIKIYEDKIIKSKNYLENKVEQEKLKEKKILQPRMRFKPRTELERIIEMMDLFGNKNKKYNKLIFEQMKKIDINAVKHYSGYGKLRKLYKNKNIKIIEDQKIKNKEIDEDSNVDKANKDKDFNHKNKEENNLQSIDDNINKNENKKDKDKINNNPQDIIKLKNKILKDLFKDEQKLYFKGASQYASSYNIINKSNKNNLKFSRTNSAINQFNLKIRRIMHINNKNKNIRKLFSSTNKAKKDSFSSFDDLSNISLNGLGYNTKNKHKAKKINEEINNSLFFNYSNCINNNLKINLKEKEEQNLQEKLDYLKKIIEKKDDEKNGETFRISKNFQKFKNKNKKNEHKLKSYKDKDDGNNIKEVYIDGVKYKTKDIIKKSDVIFRKCNFYHPKSSHNKNSLIEGDGKLSFTSGLTINEFSNKYNLF